MKIAVLREMASDESRVAATPDAVMKYIGLGADIVVEKGAGEASRFLNAAYEKAGAKLGESRAATVKGADIVLCVRRPSAANIKGAAKGALVIGTMDPFGNEKEIEALGKAGFSTIAMEFMPRITRAQSMDILSSQANLAGYQGVIDGASEFDRALPMMMTAAGTVHPAKIFVMGAGVAGLQAIATARRLGAQVTATDVRPAAKEQVESLGAKFIAVEDDEFKQAETAGGYAKEMSKEYQAKQAELTASHIAMQDIVITTALIPGRPAPKLISKAMVEAMAPGSVIVDLAAERGGNCEMTKPGKVAIYKDVKIVGHTNVQGRIATSASSLYARNLLTFVDTLVDKDSKSLAIDWEDELVQATVLTRDGAVVNARLLPAEGAKPVAKKPAAKKPASKTTAAKATAAAKKAPAKKPVARKTPVKKAPAKRAAAKSAATKTSGDA